MNDPIPPIPNPAYTPTDVASAVLVLLGLLLDVATAKGWLQLDPATRASLLIALQPALAVLIGFVLVHRGIKFQSQARYVATLRSGDPAFRYAPTTTLETLPARPARPL